MRAQSLPIWTAVFRVIIIGGVRSFAFLFEKVINILLRWK